MLPDLRERAVTNLVTADPEHGDWGGTVLLRTVTELAFVIYAKAADACVYAQRAQMVAAGRDPEDLPERRH